jgi:hypothetical protein
MSFLRPAAESVYDLKFMHIASGYDRRNLMNSDLAGEGGFELSCLFFPLPRTVSDFFSRKNGAAAMASPV